MDNRGIKAESTLKTEEIHIRHLQRFLKEKNLEDPQLSEITVKFFDQYKKFRYSQSIRPDSSKRVTPDTVNKELTTFQCIFKMGVKYGYIPYNVVRDVDRDKSMAKHDRSRTITERDTLLKSGTFHKNDKKWKCYLSPQEVPEYLNLAKGKWFYCILFTMAYTGMRRGEIINLEWSDIDLEQKLLVVQSKKQSRTRIVLRQIEIHEDLVSILLRQKEKTGHMRWVFLGPRGGQVSRHSLSNAVNRMAKETKFEGIATHIFRHSLITNLVLANENPCIIREIAGHTSQHMQDLYTHISSDHRRKTINKLKYPMDSNS